MIEHFSPFCTDLSIVSYTYKKVARSGKAHNSLLRSSVVMRNRVLKRTSRRQMPSFEIGSQRTSGPLVSVAQVKGHLRLLRTFRNLRVIVEECKDRRIPAFARQMDRDSRWIWFITLAIDRYVESLVFDAHTVMPRQDLSNGSSLCNSYLLRSSSINSFHPLMCGWFGMPIY
jgi:hypothetical protein